MPCIPPSLFCLCPHRAETLSDAFVWRLSVAYIGLNSRTERPRKTKIGTEVAHVTRDSDTSFKVRSQLVADVLNSQHARIGATWRINTKILSTCRGRMHIVAAVCLQLVCLLGFNGSFSTNRLYHVIVVGNVSQRDGRQQRHTIKQYNKPRKL